MTSQISFTDLHSDAMFNILSFLSASDIESGPRLVSKQKVTAGRKQTSLAQVTPSPNTELQILKKDTVESVSGSLESMDSIAESYWDPDDEASNLTPLVRNTHNHTDIFFVEHVNFLKVQTQPRRVEQVYTETQTHSKEYTKGLSDLVT